VKKRLYLDLSENSIVSLYGIADENLRLIERILRVSIIGKDNKILIKGKKKDIQDAQFVLKNLIQQVESGLPVSKLLVEEIIEYVRSGKKFYEETKEEKFDIEEGLLVSSKRELVKPKTKNQKIYIKAILENQIVFGIGPAGTGKTYLATAAGLYFLREKFVERIVLVRPVVEAGESLGFLPGDMKEKIDPYLRPLYDAIYDMIEPRVFKELMQNEIIEIAPLAYMRGRTLNKAFIILDEAQNTTIDQMKMFLTRTGNDSKVVITGDITQIDLPVGKKSGLIHAREIFEKTEGMKFVYFTAEDVSRAEIVKKILEAYERYEKNK
jgi:phosphate starvation-inducible PhoH-like protein